MISKNISNLMLALMLALGLTGCVQEDNPATPDYSKVVLGQWYSEDSTPGSLDAHGITIGYEKSVIYASFDEDGTGFWSIIFVDEYGDAIDIPSYFCGGGFTYSFKDANTAHVKMTSSGIPVMSDEWDVTVSDNTIAVRETGRPLSPIAEKAYPSVQRWLRQLGLGNGDDQDESEPHLSLSANELIVYYGETETLTATIFPAGVESDDVVWSSNYTRVATVDDKGVVKGVHTGSAIITARSKTDKTLYDRCRVMVVMPDVTSVTLDKTSLEMGVSDTQQLTAMVEPYYAKNPTIVWSSSDDKVASVDENGLVKALSKGKATITAKSEDSGLTAQCEITVSALSAIWHTGSKLTVKFQYGWDILRRENICKLTGKYNGTRFDSSFDGVIDEANTNVLNLKEGIYFTVHRGRAMGMPWDKTGIAWTFHTDDTYSYKCGEIPAANPNGYKLISVTINGIDITDQLTIK